MRAFKKAKAAKALRARHIQSECSQQLGQHLPLLRAPPSLSSLQLVTVGHSALVTVGHSALRALLRHLASQLSCLPGVIPQEQGTVLEMTCGSPFKDSLVARHYPYLPNP